MGRTTAQDYKFLQQQVGPAAAFIMDIKICLALALNRASAALSILKP